MKNVKMISFKNNYSNLNNLIQVYEPSVIIDHLSFYIDQSSHKEMYKNIDKNRIVYFLHSAILYKNDVSYLNIQRCFNLYEEKSKHSSWKNIQNNYFITLGHDNFADNYNFSDNDNVCDIVQKSKKIRVSIIGRVDAEKIPLDFFKLLCDISMYI